VTASNGTQTAVRAYPAIVTASTAGCGRPAPPRPAEQQGDRLTGAGDRADGQSDAPSETAAVRTGPPARGPCRRPADRPKPITSPGDQVRRAGRRSRSTARTRAPWLTSGSAIMFGAVAVSLDVRCWHYILQTPGTTVLVVDRGDVDAGFVGRAHGALERSSPACRGVAGR
jgi:hypothetical protein